MSDSYIPVVVRDGTKTFTVLENNPEVMTTLAHKFGLSKTLAFHDVYSLTDPELINIIPRPVYALLVILPLTPAWEANRITEDRDITDYVGKGPEEPVIWFKQTIGHACGSIGLLHCALNGDAAKFIEKGSFLEKLKKDVVPLGMEDRAQHLYDSKEFETHHQSVAAMGDTTAPSAEEGDRLGQHFVAFIKAADGHLYELEGSRKGPLDRGLLSQEEDVLSPRAIELGIGRVIALDKLAGGDDLRFSATALSSAVPE